MTSNMSIFSESQENGELPVELAKLIINEIPLLHGILNLMDNFLYK